MSKKLLTTLTAILLLFSTIAIAIQPASALPEDYLKGTAEWAANPDVTDADGLALGIYSAKLDISPAGYAGVELIPPSGITIADLADITSDWNFWYYLEAGADYGPLMELRFVGPLNTDPGGAHHVDITVSTAEHTFEVDDWIKEVVDSDSTVFFYGNKADSTSVDHPDYELMSGIEAIIETELGYSDVGDWELVRVRVEIGWVGIARVCYIDDVTIDDVTYLLEPIVLDKDYYKIGASVAVTVVDIYANVRPEVVETIEVTAASNYPDQITVELTETDINTGVFEGSFSIVEEIPGLLVRDGSTITVTYDDVSDTAEVDNTAPTIKPYSEPPQYPGKDDIINTQTPTIKATLSDGNTVVSGIASAMMKLDGVTVASVAEADKILYTVPSYPVELKLSEGPHVVEVTAYDKAGNSATKTWSFTVDLTEPTVSVVVDPDPAGPGDVTFTLTFNEDMHITVPPVVKFGKVSPYTTHTVSPVGEGWTDSREWVGTFTVTTATGDGLNTISISGAEDEAGNVMDVDTTNTFVIDTALPSAPTDLVATATDVSITLTWTASTDEDGTGVERYDIYCGKASPPVTLIDTVDHPTTTYTDYGPLEEATYYYKVVAVDYAGNEAASAVVSIEFVPGVVIAYPVELVEGWNLVSLPLIPEDPSIEVVLVDVSDDVEVVWSYSYDAETDTWSWSYYLPAVPELGELTEMVDGAGYWVKMTADAELIVYGTELPAPPEVPPVYHVYAGWNLIGFKEITSMDIDDYLATIPKELKLHAVIYGWNAADQRYQLVYLAGFAQPPKDTAMFVPGQGYWLYLIDEAYIAPP